MALRSSLRDLFILDFTRLLPGPFATSLLSELGARVVKVEDPRGSDFARFMSPEVDGSGYAFTAVNRGKESIAIDLKTSAGREVAHRFAQRADVIVESFRPGVMQRLGLSYDAVRASNARVVYASLSGYGASGPLRDEPGHDLNYVALAGLLALTGPRERPYVPAFQVADMTGGLYAAIAILAALRDRDRTGQGAFLDLSLHDAALGTSVLTLTRAAAGEPLHRGEMELAGAMPGYNVYACADGEWLALGALEPKFWDRFIEAVARPDLASLHASNDPAAFEAVGALFTTQTASAWEARLIAAGVPATRVLDPTQVLAHPHTRARTGGATPTPGFPVTGQAASDPPPRAGEHTERLLQEVGYGPQEIADLKARGAVAAHPPA